MVGLKEQPKNGLLGWSSSWLEELRMWHLGKLHRREKVSCKILGLAINQTLTYILGCAIVIPTLTLGPLIPGT